MLWGTWLWTFLVDALVVSALSPINPVQSQEQKEQLLNASDIAGLLAGAGNSTSEATLSQDALSAGVHVECRGTGLWGHDLNIASCRDALTQINGKSTVYRTYAPRGTAHIHYNVGLPLRYASCGYKTARHVDLYAEAR